MKYNPFAYLRSEKDILKLVNTIIANTKGDGEKSGEDFWVKAEKLYYTALIGYIWYEAPDEEKNFTTLLEMINASEAREDDEDFKNPVDLMFERLEEKDPEHFAVKQYKKYKLAAGVVCSKRLLKLVEDLKTAETAYNKCKESLAGVRGTIDQLRKQLEDGADIDADRLQKEKDEHTAQKSANTAKQKAVHARISSNQNALDGISRKAAEMEKLDNKYAWMKALSDTANGTVYGKDKMMLETYIQATYFERILARANIRLQKMSGGQYDLKRRVEADNKKSQSGLELDIIDHINATERSVNTLSGGEAFLASLALALGLSDEVQMSTGIRLDTLFVDEGFGSLDSDALGKAYSTLAGLTEGNRLVGIISHVAELKEKIDKQIVVKKEKTGESRAEIRI